MSTSDALMLMVHSGVNQVWLSPENVGIEGTFDVFYATFNGAI